MKTASETYIFEWKVFEPGDRVSPTSTRCVLPPGVYIVEEFHNPLIPFELDGTVFVEGHRTGVSAEYLGLSTT